ncbi:MAG: hydantoinase/oxoprolinase family protein, partial [Acidimicrobiales bacterium]|nr:hydantoinase/oxoprolinase family protein [Acidimicrobiales bacterium]
AARLAEKLGIGRVLVPLDASVGSAVGFLRAPVAFELARSLAQREDRFDCGAVNRLLAEMEREARAIVAPGALGAPLAVRRAVEMRYLGQGHEMAIALPAGELRPSDAAQLRAEYERRYEAQY